MVWDNPLVHWAGGPSCATPSKNIGVLKKHFAGHESKMPYQVLRKKLTLSQPKHYKQLKTLSVDVCGKFLL